MAVGRTGHSLARLGTENHIGDGNSGKLDREQRPTLPQPLVDEGFQRREQREPDRHEQRRSADENTGSSKWTPLGPRMAMERS